MNTVAVVVPLSDKPGLTADEQVSLRHLTHYLGRYDRFVVAPASATVDFPGFGVVRFPDDRFGSVLAHTRLMLSPAFYGAFESYEFILIYHLDALVLSDQLADWCARGYDYIGAPFFEAMTHEPNPAQRTYGDLTGGVGNGGFSLRKVQSFLQVLRADSTIVKPERLQDRLVALPLQWAKRLLGISAAQWEIRRHWPDAEDNFFAYRASFYKPDFRNAPVADALRFAWEVKPRQCFELTGGVLPFGCHAWFKYDRAFWEPYLLGVG